MGCLNDNTVVALVEGTLSQQARAELLLHVDDCDACRELVALAAEALLQSCERQKAPDNDNHGLDDLTPLERVGRYVILEAVGSGGMGVVYAAYDPELDRKVAIKLLRPDLSGSSSRLTQRLKREAQALARLKHPSVVTVHDVGAHLDQVFIAMEFVHGQTLGAWLEAQSRATDEVLRVLRDAGSGLAAAHRAGLVHRDFKPDNVLVEKDGRVVVTDFGLARTLLDSDTDPASTDRPSSSTKDSVVDEPLTQSRALLGTPLFMAPEQMRREPIDRRADIYSFCVTAWEALYRQRPFDGDSVDELLRSRSEDRVVEAPRRGVPRRIRELLLRGMRADRDQRFETMDDLVSELGASSNRRWWLLATLLCVAVVSLWLWTSREGGRALCTGADDHLAAVWNDDVRADINGAFAATDAPYAEQARANIVKALDSYGRGWSEMHTETCRATQVRGEQSEVLLDLRMSCLGRRLSEMAELSALFARADKDIVAKAVEATANLRPLSDCADGDRLRASGGSSLAADVRAPIEKAVDSVRALIAAGKLAEAQGAAAAAQRMAAEAGAGALEAEAMWLGGVVTDQLGDIAEAERMLTRAALQATSLGYDELAVEAMADLAHVTGARKAELERGLQWGSTATALLERIGEPTLLTATLATKLGIIKQAGGQYEAAHADLSRALELRKRKLGDDHPQVATAQEHLAKTLRYRGMWDEALSAFERALVVRRRALGSMHPAVANTLRGLADLQSRIGRYDAAVASLEEALAIEQVIFGKSHLQYAYTLNAMGNVHQYRGEHSQALAFYRRAVAIGEETLGSEHPEVAMAHSNSALALTSMGRFDDALVIVRRSLDKLEASVGNKHHYSAMVRSIEGDALAGLGRCEDAIASYQAAITTDESALGHDHHDLAEPLTGLGLCLLTLSQNERALAALERAHALRKPERATAMEVGRTMLALADSLWTSGDKTRAQQLVRDVHARYERAGFAQASARRKRQLAEVKRLLER